MKLAKTPSFIALIATCLAFSAGPAGAECPAGQIRDHNITGMPCVPNPAVSTPENKKEDKEDKKADSLGLTGETTESHDTKAHSDDDSKTKTPTVASPLAGKQKAEDLLRMSDGDLKIINENWPGSYDSTLSRFKEIEDKIDDRVARKPELGPGLDRMKGDVAAQIKAVFGLGVEYVTDQKERGGREFTPQEQEKYNKKMEAIRVGGFNSIPIPPGGAGVFRFDSRDDADDKGTTNAHGGKHGSGPSDIQNSKKGTQSTSGGRQIAGLVHNAFMEHRSGGSPGTGMTSQLTSIMRSVEKNHMENTAQSDRNNSNSQAGAGWESNRKKKYPDAVNYFNRALDIDAKNASALSGRAQAKYGLGDYPGANKDANAALAITPDDKGALAVDRLTDERGAGAMPTIVGMGSQDSSGFAAGGGGLQRGIAGGRDSHHTDFNRQSARALSLRDYKEAATQASLALNQNPSNAQAYNFRAMANLGLRDYSKSLSDANAGLKLAPRNIPLLNSKAQAMLRMKDYKGALDAAKQALGINPKDAASLAQKAYALGAMGDREAMLAALRQAAAIDPRYNSSLQSALQLPSDSDVMFLFPGEEGSAGASGGGGLFGKGRRFGILGAAALAGGLLLAFGLLPYVLPPITKKLQTLVSHRGQVSPAVTPSGVLDDIPQEGAALLRGQYRIGEQIGSGGMGLVYDGLDVTLDRRVAIKRLRSEFAADHRERERFISEAKTVAGLKHLHIVEIYSIVEEDSDVYLIFEHIPGGTLFDHLAKNGPMSHAEGLSVLKQIGTALDYAHSKGIIHRDLKPSNVMFDSDGRVKVMDFGIARLAKDAMNRFTLTNTVVGTPPYMAPEQEQGVVGRQADVYSLAICYYEMLSGRLPFAGSSAGLLVNKMNMNYKPITEIVPGLPPALDEVFAGAFTPDPEKRPSSPSELLAALEALQVA